MKANREKQWPVENGSVAGPLLNVSEYAVSMIKKIQYENIKSLAPRQDITDSFNEHAQVRPRFCDLNTTRVDMRRRNGTSIQCGKTHVEAGTRITTPDESTQSGLDRPFIMVSCVTTFLSEGQY